MVAVEHADEAARRAGVAEATVTHRTAPAAVANRIARLRDQVRQLERTATTPDASTRLDQAREDLEYWGSVRAQQVAEGTVTEYGPENVHRGDHVKIGRLWFEVVRANRKTVTVPSTLGSWTDTAPWHKVVDHRPA